MILKVVHVVEAALERKACPSCLLLDYQHDETGRLNCDCSCSAPAQGRLALFVHPFFAFSLDSLKLLPSTDCNTILGSPVQSTGHW